MMNKEELLQMYIDYLIGFIRRNVDNLSNIWFLTYDDWKKKNGKEEF